MQRVVRCLITLLAGDLLVRAACSSLAYGRSENSGFDGYRTGVVAIGGVAWFGGCRSGFRFGVVSGCDGLAGPLMVLPKTSLSVGRGRIRDGMPVSTLCVGDATPIYECRQGLVRHGRHLARTRTATRPESRSPPDTGIRFSIPNSAVRAGSRQPPPPIIIEAGVTSPPLSRGETGLKSKPAKGN